MFFVFLPGTHAQEIIIRVEINKPLVMTNRIRQHQQLEGSFYRKCFVSALTMTNALVASSLTVVLFAFNLIMMQETIICDNVDRRRLFRVFQSERQCGFSVAG